MIEYINKISYSNKPWAVVFTGRRIISGDPKVINYLKLQGVAKESSPGNFFYSGAAFAKLKDGTKIEVPESGFLDISINDITNPENFIEVSDNVQPSK